MPVGIISACLAVLAGGVLGGTVCKRSTPPYLKENLPVMFGLCAMGLGINGVIKVANMPVAVLATLLGFIIGQLLHLQEHTTRFFRWLVSAMHLGGKEVDMNLYITVVAIFCCSGTGFYGVMSEAIAGDSSILLSKAIMDLFTSLVFATTLGVSVCAIPLPQFVIFMLVFGVSKVVGPFLTPTMFADLSGCGGLLTLGTALRVAKIKEAPIVDMMPALILVMPLSALWTSLMG